MSSFEIALSKIPPAWRNPEKGDYLGEDGLVYCGQCRTAKQVRLPPLGRLPERTVNCLCRCRSEQIEKQDKARKLQEELDRRRREGLTDPKYYQYRFDNDDRRNASFSNSCMRYVQQWEEYEKTGTGILFLGSCGTGKTFYACCIANALMEKGVSALVMSIPTAIRHLEANGNDTVEKIQRPRLLVLDDLGAERNTSTAIESLYEIIDTRYRTGKPMIVTTNLGYNELTDPVGTQDISKMDRMRIYDRIFEKCRLFRVDGPSRRTENLNAPRCQQKAQEGASPQSNEFTDWNSKTPSYGDARALSESLSKIQADEAIRNNQRRAGTD